jgi:hypothetical protein
MGTLAGHPSEVDAKRGDLLQADESGVWTGTPPVTPELL